KILLERISTYAFVRRFTMRQAITGFHQDKEGHWVADLECGHSQHVRHDPPWTERPWVTTEEGRKKFLGQTLTCVRCDEIGLEVARDVIEACRKILAEKYEEAGMSGLCDE